MENNIIKYPYLSFLFINNINIIYNYLQPNYKKNCFYF